MTDDRKQGLGDWRSFPRPYRLHIGCGEVDLAGFVNIDARPMPHVHIVKDDLFDLSVFEDNTIEMIYMCHILEHVRRNDLPAVLEELRRVLIPGGVLRISVPDFDRIIEIYMDNGRSIESIEKPLMGGQEYAYNFHFLVFNRQSLTRALVAAGFKSVRAWAPRQMDFSGVVDWSSRPYQHDGKTYPISLNIEAIR